MPKINHHDAYGVVCNYSMARSGDNSRLSAVVVALAVGAVYLYNQLYISPNILAD